MLYAIFLFPSEFDIDFILSYLLLCTLDVLHKYFPISFSLRVIKVMLFHFSLKSFFRAGNPGCTITRLCSNSLIYRQRRSIGLAPERVSDRCLLESPLLCVTFFTFVWHNKKHVCGGSNQWIAFSAQLCRTDHAMYMSIQLASNPVTAYTTMLIQHNAEKIKLICICINREK